MKRIFNGFTQKTIKYFTEIRSNNNKLFFSEHRDEYVLHVKYPLIELYDQLIGPLMAFDDQIDYRLSKCISSPYTDARFCRSNPIKEYMYLRFKLLRHRKTDIPGFYFDASADLIRFGVKLYNTTSNGMQKIRDYFEKNQKSSKGTLVKIEDQTTFIVEGKSFKKDHYPAFNEPLKKWLNFRDINVFYTLKDYDLFLSPGLAKLINATFTSLQPLYNIMKISVDN